VPARHCRRGDAHGTATAWPRPLHRTEWRGTAAAPPRHRDGSQWNGRPLTAADVAAELFHSESPSTLTAVRARHTRTNPKGHRTAEGARKPNKTIDTNKTNETIKQTNERSNDQTNKPP
jgi:hypothetical protein